MFTFRRLLMFCLLIRACVSISPLGLVAQETPAEVLARYRSVAKVSGDAPAGRIVFKSKATACSKCHAVDLQQNAAGPALTVIGDKYSKDQLIEAVLQPSALIHPDYATLVVTTQAGRVHTGILQRRSAESLQMIDAEARVLELRLSEIEEEQRVKTSLMPAQFEKTMTPPQFADLIAYLQTLRQPLEKHPLKGLQNTIASVETPITLQPFTKGPAKYDHPVWIISVPGAKDDFLVIEQQTRKIWRIREGDRLEDRTLFVDLTAESITGQFDGVMCLAFHPRFEENGKYYVNHHVREEGRFSPVIIERQATDDLSRDSGAPSRRLIKIEQDTDLHWGGMLAFGPDGYLYVGAGDGGPQEDPDGNGQNLERLRGSILRIDVDARDGKLPYAIPPTNPYVESPPKVRKEIWASGFRMPWRFSFDALTGDLWVGEIGQNLFEEISVVRSGENHGWNVYEGFWEFSDQYRKPTLKYTPPVISYRRSLGVSVTGGYVYRGTRNTSYQGAYIFGDFESRRIWAMTQENRNLIKVRQIGTSPEKIASFGLDPDGELLLVGYGGTLYRLLLEDSIFE